MHSHKKYSVRWVQQFTDITLHDFWVMKSFERPNFQGQFFTYLGLQKCKHALRTWWYSTEATCDSQCGQMLCAYWLTNYCMGGKQWSQRFQALLLHCLSTALCKWLTLFQTKDFTIQYIMYSLPGSAIIPEDKAIHVGLLNSLCWRLFLWMVTDTCHLGTFMWLKRLLWLTHFTVNFI